MFFVINCADKLGNLDLRIKTRPAHVEYLQSLGNIVKSAGPFIDDNGNMAGTMAIVEVADKSAALHIAENDPYAKSGLFQSVSIFAWKWVLKNPEAA